MQHLVLAILLFVINYLFLHSKVLYIVCGLVLRPDALSRILELWHKFYYHFSRKIYFRKLQNYITQSGFINDDAFRRTKNITITGKR